MLIDRRWLVGGVALSLLLNVFLLGFIVSHLYADRRQQMERYSLVSMAQVQSLPSDEKAKFVDAMAARQASIAAVRKAHLTARQTLAETIAAPIFDRARVAAGFADLRHASIVAQETTNAALIDAFAGLSQASRASLVARDPDGGDHR